MRIPRDCRAKIKSMNDDRQIHHRPLGVLAISVILLASTAIALITGVSLSREACRNLVDDPRPYLRHCCGWIAEAAKMGLVACRWAICRQCRRRRSADFYRRTGERRIRSSNRRGLCDLSNQIASQRVFRYPILPRLKYFGPPALWCFLLPAASNLLFDFRSVPT